jgi:putative ubiquitin-RnfH superfamily antitoxin RatB of RatAB toxin-antitoxin module
MLQIMIVNTLTAPQSKSHVIDLDIHQYLNQQHELRLCDLLQIAAPEMGYTIDHANDLVIGVYGKRHSTQTLLSDVLSDLLYPQSIDFNTLNALKMPIRIEIYAPLSADPMQQRRNKDKAKSKK